MEKSININLLNALFISPKPLPEKLETYNLLINRIFPDKEGFIKFLSTNDANEQLKIAKTLMQRLCFESNFPPAYDLLINLLAFEHSEVNQSKSNMYVPQDHFIHELNSYIFGIYLFFYHPILNKKLTSHFMGIRSEDNINPVLSATKDFISFWKYFCLFHDIAYPIESAYKLDKSDNKIKIKENKYKEFLEPFDNIYLSSYKEWISSALSRYITIYDLLFDPENKDINQTFINKSASYFCINKNEYNYSATELVSLFKGYTCIDKLYSFEHYKLFTGFVNKNDILLLLIDKYTEVPIAFKFYRDNDKLMYKIKYYYFDLSNLGIEYFLDTDEDHFSDRYKLQFCIKNCSNQFEKINISHGYSKFNKAKFQQIKNVLFKNQEQKKNFDRVTDASELENYIFEYFQLIYNYCNRILKSNDTLKYFNHSYLFKLIKDREIYLNNYKENFHEIIKETIISYLDFNIIKKDNEFQNWLFNDNRHEEKLEKIINDMLVNVLQKIVSQKEVNKINADIIKKINCLIENEQIEENTLIEIICKIAYVLLPDFSVEFTDKQLFCNNFDIESFINSIDKCKESDFISNIFKSLETFLKSFVDSDNCTKNIVLNYRNDFFPLDHGIFGAYIYILSEYISYKVLISTFSNKNVIAKAASTLIWPVSFENYQKKLIENYNTISSDIAKSIFAHNIYSKCFNNIFKEANWEININSEPCCYFAMLVDALQVWDRRKYNHVAIDYNIFFEADSFNITVHNKKLCISMRCHSKNIKKSYDKFMKSFDEYLSDASTLLSISFDGI